MTTDDDDALAGALVFGPGKPQPPDSALPKRGVVEEEEFWEEDARRRYEEMAEESGAARRPMRWEY